MTGREMSCWLFVFVRLARYCKSTWRRMEQIQCCRDIVTLCCKNEYLAICSNGRRNGWQEANIKIFPPTVKVKHYPQTQHVCQKTEVLWSLVTTLKKKITVLYYALYSELLLLIFFAINLCSQNVIREIMPSKKDPKVMFHMNNADTFKS